MQNQAYRRYDSANLFLFAASGPTGAAIADGTARLLFGFVVNAL